MKTIVTRASMALKLITIQMVGAQYVVPLEHTLKMVGAFIKVWL